MYRERRNINSILSITLKTSCVLSQDSCSKQQPILWLPFSVDSVGRSRSHILWGVSDTAQQECCGWAKVYLSQNWNYLYETKCFSDLTLLGLYLYSAIIHYTLFSNLLNDFRTSGLLFEKAHGCKAVRGNLYIIHMYVNHTQRVSNHGKANHVECQKNEIVVLYWEAAFSSHYLATLHIFYIFVADPLYLIKIFLIFLS